MLHSKLGLAVWGGLSFTEIELLFRKGKNHQFPLGMRNLTQRQEMMDIVVTFHTEEI